MYDYAVLFFCVFSDLISKHLDQYAAVLHRTGSSCRNFTLPAKLYCLFGNLVAQSLHHRDIVQSELATPFIPIQPHVYLYAKLMHCLFYWLLVIE